MRGVELGRAIGADVIQEVTDLRGYDHVIAVKRYGMALAGCGVIWDLVDSYPQPAGNLWTESDCKAWLKGQIQSVRPKGIVAATEAMALDCVFGVPILALPHHARPGEPINPIRETVGKVGYQGAEHYLGFWRDILDRECAKRGWQFVIEPEHLADVDIVVALRAQDGYAARTWKSNVKLANAQSTGTPVICSPEAGYMETASGAEYWAKNEADLVKAFDALTPHDRRQQVSHFLLKATPKLEDLARIYKEWLSRF